MQYPLNRDHQHHKWRQQKSWIFYQDYQDAQDKQQTQYQLTPRSKWKMLQNYWKIPKSECPYIWFVYHDTNGQNNGPVWKTQSRSSRKESVRSSFGRTVAGKAIQESSFGTRLGKSSTLGMLICQPRKRTMLVCVCGRYKIGWKKTEHQSNMENAYERRWFGSTNIIPWPCVVRILWTISKVCLNLGFLLVLWKITEAKALGKWDKHYLFMVLWHGRSCEEMHGKMLWTGE